MQKLNGFKIAKNADLRNSKYVTGSRPGGQNFPRCCVSLSDTKCEKSIRKAPLSNSKGPSDPSVGDKGKVVERLGVDKKMAIRYTGTSPVSDSSEDEFAKTLEQVCTDTRGGRRRWSGSDDGDDDSSATYPADTTGASTPELGSGSQGSGGETRTSSFEFDAGGCEMFRKMIQEAPLVSTVREPVLDAEYSCSVATIEDRVDCFKDQEQQSGSVSTGTCSKSVSRSVSARTESSVSISTFDVEIPWLNPSLVEEGRDFVRRNFMSIMFAHLVGLIFLLCVKPISAILLRYGRFHKKGKRNHWHQYLLLLRRLKFWYEARRCDFTDPDDLVTADILKVRKGLCKAGRNFRKYVPPPAQELALTTPEEALLFALREDLKIGDHVEEDKKNLPKILTTIKPDVPWSQYDLAVVQFAFFGLVATYPGLFGIWNRRGIRGFVHLWAVFGHLLGLQEQFNLASPANFDETTNERVFKDVLVFSLRNADCAMFRMTQLLCDGVKWWTICMTRMKLMLLFMTRDLAKVDNTKNLNSNLAWYEKLEYWMYTVWLKWVGRIFFMRILANFMGRLVLLEAYAVYLAQMKWKSWRAKRRPKQVVLFPLDSLSQFDQSVINSSKA